MFPCVTFQTFQYLCVVILRQERTCEEATSFDLTPYEVASAITAVDRLLVEQMKVATAGETLADCDVDYDSGWNPYFDG